jgi:hypothetical protein
LPWLGLAILAGVLASSLPQIEGAESDGDAFFETHVRPVLMNRCSACHGRDKQEGQLRVDSLEALLSGGESGPAIVPGRSEESLLVEAIRQQGFVVMPPEGRLSDGQVAAIAQWIDRGAHWPAGAKSLGPALGDQVAIWEAADSHWAFRPIQAPAVPQVTVAGQQLGPIDAFVHQRLQQDGLAMAEPTDRRTWLRRVSLTLTGLPPSFESLEAFAQDRAEGAHERAIDGLLASEHYGERWARHWLDIARYADTRDWQAQVDPRYPHAYTYRDYVIAAFQSDKPYDTFIREQLAADLITDSPDAPELAALGFLTVGPRFRNNRLEQVADRIDVVTRGLMGLSVGCARCHDHKYDPIHIDDYYALYGVFASTDEPEELPLIAADGPPPEMVADYEAARQAELEKLAAYKQDLRDQALTDLMKRPTEYLEGYYEMSVEGSTNIRGLLSSRKLKETAMTPLADALERLRRQPRWRNDAVLGPWLTLIGKNEAEFGPALTAILESGLIGDKPVHPLVLAKLQAEKPADAKSLLVAYGQLLSELPEATESASSDGSSDDWAAIREAFLGEGGLFDLDVDAVTQASRLLGQGRVKLGQFQTALQEVEASHPGAPPRAMAMVDRDAPVNPVVFLRGDPAQRGEAVPRRFLSYLDEVRTAPFENGSGRAELADAIVSAKNPLTARVIVNWVWAHHFGQGLVDYADDFGLRSPPPSHPELLDWLAAEFIAHDWSFHWLHREILLSKTFAQSSLVKNHKAEELDPENRLLWRMNRRRLDFESLRDAVLAASGELDPQVGGRSVELFEKPYSKRRTLYGHVDRVEPHGVFATFDAPSPDAAALVRTQTMVPQQALFALNHPFMIAQARAIIAQPGFAKQSDSPSKTRWLYRRVFGRQPTRVEITLADRFVHLAEQTGSRELPQWQYGYGEVTESRVNFHPLPHWTGEAYQISAEYPHSDPKLGHVRVLQTTAHPGRTKQTGVIRRWVAPMDLVVKIEGQVIHKRDTGDGIRARIVASRGGVLGEWTLHNKTVEATVARYEVKAGETIDFVVDCQGNPAADVHEWSPRLVTLEGKPKRFDAAAGFAAPPPPPLGAWEQVAQALLLTNEFTFVD